MNDKLQPVLVILATAGMIVVNYFAATGVLGGIDTRFYRRSWKDFARFAAPIF
jgi:hypothetical protein